MTTAVLLSGRDRSLLRLLSWTPVTTTLLLRASSTFDGDPFHDERRLRERLQTLARVGFIRSWSTAHAGGGLQNYYKLTAAGFQALSGPDAELPPRAFFAEISPALFEHTLTLAEVIVQTQCGCHTRRVTINRFFRENELTFTVGDQHVQPDCFIRFAAGGKNFSVAFEIDQSTESVDSHASNSIRHKLQTYDAYQESALQQWLQHAKAWERPRLRVAFLTRTIERAYHILALVRQVAVNKSRRVVYAATQESYLAETDPVRLPIFLDHDGTWQSLVDLHPTARHTRAAVKLPCPLETALPL
jgi:hypothetical protein